MRILISTAIFIVFSGMVQAQTKIEEQPTQTDGGQRKDGRETGQKLLDELRISPKPAEQTDLNTVSLASAHRERAASVEEKTNGLWQSWLVSICQGCGEDRMPAAEQDGSIYAKKMRDQAQGPAAKPRYTYFYPTRALRGSRQTIAENLSNESIDQIRRDPNR